ncbi:hypothetical protein AVEN_96187-1 [Araneus ventricosus]|uniref:Uncharacterized protein n=1 Tax=Araneus ventricosus TaxID=182803 RepID=A0A4Y2FSS8_ARAVE|nr:hypothetical protein AVEN_96187-1 [Araneus ventricosus]
MWLPFPVHRAGQTALSTDLSRWSPEERVSATVKMSGLRKCGVASAPDIHLSCLRLSRETFETDLACSRFLEGRWATWMQLQRC